MNVGSALTDTRWIGGILFAVLASLIFGMNLVVLLHHMRRRSYASVVPVFGGLFGASALIVLPMTGLWHWWLPLLIDWGGVPSITFAAIRGQCRGESPSIDIDRRRKIEHGVD